MGTNSVQKPYYRDITHTLVGLTKKEIYSKLLETWEWYQFRDVIHNRDEYSCLHCNRRRGINEERLTGKTLETVIDYNLRVRIHNKTLDDIYSEQKGDFKINPILEPPEGEKMDQFEEWLCFMENSSSPLNNKVANFFKEGILLKEGFGYNPFNSMYKRVFPLSELSEYQSIIIAFFETHHTLYFEDRLPWQYEPKYLKTLCQDCHKEVHRTETIYVYPTEEIYLNPEKSALFRQVFINCTKCGGTGHLPEYNYYQNGICFDCGGTGAAI